MLVARTIAGAVSANLSGTAKPITVTEGNTTKSNTDSRLSVEKVKVRPAQNNLTQSGPKLDGVKSSQPKVKLDGSAVDSADQNVAPSAPAANNQVEVNGNASNGEATQSIAPPLELDARAQTAAPPRCTSK